jgi:hypothetical protein
LLALLDNNYVIYLTRLLKRLCTSKIIDDLGMWIPMQALFGFLSRVDGQIISCVTGGQTKKNKFYAVGAKFASCREHDAIFFNCRGTAPISRF